MAKNANQRCDVRYVLDSRTPTGVTISELYAVSRSNMNGKQPLSTSVTSCLTRQRMRIDCNAIVTSGWRPWIKNVCPELPSIYVVSIWRYHSRFSHCESYLFHPDCSMLTGLSFWIDVNHDCLPLRRNKRVPVCPWPVHGSTRGLLLRMPGGVRRKKLWNQWVPLVSTTGTGRGVRGHARPGNSPSPLGSSCTYDKLQK